MEATDGKEGVRIALEHRPDIILMDIQLPGMDGIEATRILKSTDETKEIPVIAITAHVMRAEIEDIRRSGFDGYISKPFRISKIIKEIEGYLD